MLDLSVGLSYFNENGNHYITFDFVNNFKGVYIRFEINDAFILINNEILKIDFEIGMNPEKAKKMKNFVGTKENNYYYLSDVSIKRTLNQKSNLYLFLKNIKSYNALLEIIINVLNKEFDPNESKCFFDKTFDFFYSISNENNITESINIKTRKFIKQVKMINNTGLGNFINGNFYDYTENMKNNNYIVINGINVNKSRVKFIEVYSEPPVSNADAVKQINPVS